MPIGLLGRVPVVGNLNFLKKYSSYLTTAEIKVDTTLWVVLSLVVSLLFGAGAWYVSDQIIGIEQGLQVGLVFFIVVLDLMTGFPYIMAQRRISQIEEALPDVLRQIADTLKAGGTYEYALREVASAEYGPLKRELNEVLRKLEEGQNLENSLKTLSYNVDSRLVKRTVTIIIDSVKAGAGLTTILEEIAEDVRAQHRLEKERKSKTLMQTLFMFAAAGVVAPIIFGFTNTIAAILTSAPESVVTAQAKEAAVRAISIIQNSIQAYLFAEVLFTSMMISLVREGKITKSIIYFPILLFMAYMAYLGAVLVSKKLVLGAAT